MDQAHTPDERRYEVDYDWLWTNPPHNDGTPATVRMTVTDGRRDAAAPAVEAWLGTLTPSGDAFVCGGWVARVIERHGSRGDAPGRVVVDLTSGGEDVADGIQDATEQAYAHLGEATDLGLTWEQLPRQVSE
ncbi:hypothetical protein [Corynebacterium frankenforstense]|uniref:hypothetical protein n=1 Tax=Corynebacterium frankenforstense TaxID=1230998 RepID=UPI0009528782|nr:hypothetical protein [Corynebacterium frankenforstense]